MKCFTAIGAKIAETSLVPEPNYFEGSDFTDIVYESHGAQPKRKIGGAFLYENTLTYLFSRTNYGKSILAFQLAFAAATGTSIADCEALCNECPPMRVFVVDLELDNLVIGERHRNAILKMGSDEISNLIYLHERCDQQIVLGYSLLEKIEEYAHFYSPKLIIIDNISRLLPDSLKPEVVTITIEILKGIQKRTGASILVIGHTTKINPKIAIQPVSYFGSSMMQNFFSEISYLDMTRDGRFFLCHAKTKHKECYTDSVPVFTRGEHPVIGLGFNYETLQPLSDVQLPFELKGESVAKKRNPNEFAEEISILHKAGKKPVRIASALDFSLRSIYRFIE